MKTKLLTARMSCILGAHLPCLIVDLQCQFSGGCQDKGDWVLLTTAIPSILLQTKVLLLFKTSCVIGYVKIMWFSLSVPVHCSWRLAEHLLARRCRSDSALAARKQQSYQSLKHSRNFMVRSFRLKMKKTKQNIKPKGVLWMTHQLLLCVFKKVQLSFLIGEINNERDCLHNHGWKVQTLINTHQSGHKPSDLSWTWWWGWHASGPAWDECSDSRWYSP